MILLLKSRVKTYTRKDGRVINEHFRRAAKFAAEKHKGQYRGDGKTPYIYHPVTVANILYREGGVTDPVVMLAALLHDTIEDTDTTHGDLVRLFGKDVADVVREVTNDTSLDKASQKQAQIDHGKSRSERANTLKMADKIANLRDVIASPPNWDLDRKKDYFDHAKKVIEAMPNANRKLLALFMQEYLNKPA